MFPVVFRNLARGLQTPDLPMLPYQERLMVKSQEKCQGQSWPYRRSLPIPAVPRVRYPQVHLPPIGADSNTVQGSCQLGSIVASSLGRRYEGGVTKPAEPLRVAVALGVSVPLLVALGAGSRLGVTGPGLMLPDSPGCMLLSCAFSRCNSRAIVSLIVVLSQKHRLSHVCIDVALRSAPALLLLLLSPRSARIKVPAVIASCRDLNGSHTV